VVKLLTLACIFAFAILSCSVKSIDIAKAKETLIDYSEPPIPENEWVVVEALKLKDTSNILMVTYEICEGLIDSVFCRAVFVHKKLKKYRCVAPWLGNKELVLNYTQTITIMKELVEYK